MAELWVYLDESGSLDFDPATSGSPYFAFGSAVFQGDHSTELMSFTRARASRAKLPNGFHAYNDSNSTRSILFDEMKRMRLLFGATMMAKEHAYSYVKSRPKLWLYKYTLYRHLNDLLPKVSGAGDVVHIVAADISFEAKKDAVHYAIRDVCDQVVRGRESVVEHIWKSSTSAGLQIADYALWAVQRKKLRGTCWWYDTVVKDRMVSLNYQWGTAHSAR